MISINSTNVVGLEQQGSDVQWAICSIECDTSNELPTYDQFKQTHNILLYQKSFAHVIDKNETYEMNGQGSWIRQRSNSNIMLDAENVIYDNTDSGLSAEDVQGAIDELKSNDDMQDRALAELYAENTNQQLEINYAINTGVKNLLPMTHTSGSITRYGVTCTWNNDGTMTLNGAHSSGDSSAIFEFYNGSAENTKMLPAGSYVLTGCPAGGSTSTYRAALSQIAGAVDVGNGANFELSEPHYAAYRILISGNVTFTNMVFKPMIRLASITDSTFQPYAFPNPTLTPAVVKSVDEGAKNLIQNNCNSKTVHGVTATTNADGSITVSGSSDYTNNFLVLYDLYAGDNATSSYNSHLTLKAGTYINKGTGRSDVKLQIIEYNTSSDYSIVSAGDTDTTFTLTKSYFAARLWISSTANFSTPVTVYPMICTAADWAVSQRFVPYCPTLYELYQMILLLQSGTRSLSMQPEKLTKGESEMSLEDQYETKIIDDELANDVKAEDDEER